MDEQTGHLEDTVPLVSVITTVYNGQRDIADCLRSVADSVTCGKINVEHIIVDDGSTDQTPSVLDRMLSGNSPIRRRYYRDLNNSGKPSIGRNRGIDLAAGTYIFCLDHDDVILQNTLRYLAGHLQDNKLEIVYGDFIRGDQELRYLMADDYYGWPHRTRQEALYSIFKGDHFYQHSMMFTKNLWDRVGGYNPNIVYGEDLDICIRFILDGRLPEHLPITTHIHRNHTTNLTAGYRYKNQKWYTERRGHYQRYRHLLHHYLTTTQLAEIEQTLEINKD